MSTLVSRKYEISGEWPCFAVNKQNKSFSLPSFISMGSWSGFYEISRLVRDKNPPWSIKGEIDEERGRGKEKREREREGETSCWICVFTNTLLLYIFPLPLHIFSSEQGIITCSIMHVHICTVWHVLFQDSNASIPTNKWGYLTDMDCLYCCNHTTTGGNTFH